MKEIISELNAVRRSVGSRRMPAGEARTVVLQRTYDAPIEDVWDAITNPERIPRWFMPVSGDLREGGRFQLEGNAGGEILQCKAPDLLKVTWEFGGEVSEVEVRLTPEGAERTRFHLEHAAVVDPERWQTFGPGAVGVGWDGALLGLALHLRGGEISDDERANFHNSPEGRKFLTASSIAWGAANRAAGATEEEAAAAVENTTKFYVPEPS
ncbi:MAG TPA: SRPBCC family protein [Micromonosporaceae bacterium]|nr:SRPBCC family protein [Micromonosporaceae bacterium]